MMDSLVKECIRPYYLKWFYARASGERYPAEFARCWDFPSHAIDNGLGQWMGADSEGSDLFFFPAADWHARVQRAHHLIYELSAAGRRCFYLNPHLGREYPNPYPFSQQPVLTRLQANVYELHVHLWREPVYHHRALTRSETATIAAAVDQCLRRSHSVKPVLVVSFPLWAPVAKELNRRHAYRVIYDCHDLWSGFERIHPDVVANESQLFEISDGVIFSSRWLMEHSERKHEIGYKSMIIRNAVEPVDFDFAENPRGGRKTVIYAGSLDFWFDTEAVKHAAAAHPEWEFLLLGRIENREIRKLAQLPNIRLLGEVPYPNLRRYFAIADACIIPFRISPLTLATNPLKLYEYFASGRPVISSPLPEVLHFGELVLTARTPGEFTQQLQKALSEDSPRKAEERRRIAELETWSSRVANFRSHLERTSGSEFVVGSEFATAVRPLQIAVSTD
jgi:glycosyltransferase involved in cell wall biosynthesis